MTKFLRISVFSIVALAATTWPAAPQPAAERAAGDRAITVVSGDVYKLRDGKAYTIFLVTKDGIVLVDPLGLDTAEWLKEELAARFPNTPIKYVVLTHHHWERATGAALFAGTAQVVGQQEFRGAADVSRRAQPGQYRYVPNPRVTFADKHSIDIGGQRVDVIHVGPFHSAEMSVVSIPSQRIVFSAEAPPINTVPFEFGDTVPAEVVRWLDTVAALDFDTMLFSDGTQIGRAPLTALAGYLSLMRRQVLAGYDRGRSLDQLDDDITLDPFRTSPHYVGRRAQIESMYRRLFFSQIDFTLTGVTTYLPENTPQYCASFDSCSAGGAIAGGGVATTVFMGRRVGMQAEIIFGDQFWSTRSRPLYDEQVVFRPTRTSVLFRLNVTRSRALTVLGGYSATVGDVRGLDRVQGILRPAGGRHPITSHQRRGGWTAGFELSKRMSALRFVIPVRATVISGSLPPYWPSRFDVTAGAGIAIPVIRRIE